MLNIILFFLFEHVVKNRLDSVDGDVGISHAQDAVEFSGHESQAGFVHCFGEVLSRDAEGAHRYSVGG